MRGNPSWEWRSGERGFLTLIGLLLVIVIIGILFAMYAGGLGGGGSPATGGGAATTLGGAKNRASDTVCRNNLSQLRAAISIYAGTAGSNPSSLDSVQPGVSLTCPLGGEPYQYDPLSGKVKCVHPGHGNY